VIEFRKYSEIENSYNEKFINSLFMGGFGDKSIEYACYRKIDGSNVQISIDEQDELVLGSRNQYVGTEFPGLKRVLEKDNLEEKLRS